MYVIGGIQKKIILYNYLYTIIIALYNNTELVFGFSRAEYEVHESDGSITVEIIHALSGDYQPIVLISTHNGTATGQEYF